MMVNKTEFKQCKRCHCMKNIKVGMVICIRCERELDEINVTAIKPKTN